MEAPGDRMDGTGTVNRMNGMNRIDASSRIHPVHPVRPVSRVAWKPSWARDEILDALPRRGPTAAIILSILSILSK